MKEVIFCSSRYVTLLNSWIVPELTIAEGPAPEDAVAFEDACLIVERATGSFQDRCCHMIQAQQNVAIMQLPRSMAHQKKTLQTQAEGFEAN